MTTEEIWKQILRDCQSTQKTINCGGNLRRMTLVEIEKERRAMYEALQAGVEGFKLNPKGKKERELAIRSFMFLAEKALAKVGG